MIIQLSSGQEPVECELAVKKLYDSLKKEFPDIELISGHEAKRTEGCTFYSLSDGTGLIRAGGKYSVDLQKSL